MTRTPNEFFGPEYEDAICFADQYGVVPVIPDCYGGTIYFSDGYFQLKDQLGTFNPRSGGSGITEEQHEALDTLVHEIDETSYEEYTYTGSDITNVTVWTSVAKTMKIREEQYTYSSHRVTQVVTIQYDVSGGTKMTMTEQYTYGSGNKISSVTRTKT